MRICQRGMQNMQKRMDDLIFEVSRYKYQTEGKARGLFFLF